MKAEKKRIRRAERWEVGVWVSVLWTTSFSLAFERKKSKANEGDELETSENKKSSNWNVETERNESEDHVHTGIEHTGTHPTDADVAMAVVNVSRTVRAQTTSR